MAALLSLPANVERMRCPSSLDGVPHSGLYDREIRFFFCGSCGFEADYGEFLDELERQRRAFFERYPRMAEGQPEEEIHEVAKRLLRGRPLEPLRALELLRAWNELYGRPPLLAARLDAIVDRVAKALAGEAA